MAEASREAWKIIEQKRKYWAKTLSNDAIWSNLLSSIEIFDWLSFFGDITLSDTLFSSLIAMLLYDIPLIDLVPWNLDWVLELPDIDEFLQGVLLKIRQISISDLIDIELPDLKGIETDIDKLIDEIFDKDTAEAIKESRISKGIYGYSRYGEAYYDPVAVRDFIRSTIFFIFKKPGTYDSVKKKIEATGKTLNISSELISDYFNRLSMIEKIKERTLTWDYGWWDYSYWDLDSEKTVKFIDYELEETELEYADLFDAEAGGWWDFANWDFFYWTEDFEEYKHPWKLEKQPLIILRDKIYEDFRKRIQSTPYLVGNYLKTEERQKFTPSPRVETYHLPRHQSMIISRRVKQILRSKGLVLPPVEEQQYVNAALHLYSLRYSDNKQGLEMYKSMSEEEFRNWWLEYWSRQGLDRNTLGEIYDRLKLMINTFGSLRTTEKLRFLRRKIKLR